MSTDPSRSHTDEILIDLTRRLAALEDRLATLVAELMERPTAEALDVIERRLTNLTNNLIERRQTVDVSRLQRQIETLDEELRRHRSYERHTL